MLCKHKDLSLDLQRLCKQPSVAAHSCNPNTGEVKIGGLQGVGWSAGSQRNLISKSRFSKTLAEKKIWWRKTSDVDL